MICLKTARWMAVCRPWSDVAFCGIWSGSTLSAQACLSYYMVNILELCTPKFLIIWHKQTVQTPIRSSLIRVYTVCHSTKYFRTQLHKKQKLGKRSMKWSVRNFRNLPYLRLLVCSYFNNHSIKLTLCLLNKNFSRWHFETFLVFFLRK